MNQIIVDRQLQLTEQGDVDVLAQAEQKVLFQIDAQYLDTYLLEW